MMKNNRSVKKRKKERTWAEAATMALQSSSNKKLGVREILQTIYDKSLKCISLNKAAENVLATMLSHHVQLPNCPFFRVRSGVGVYALKGSWLKKHEEEIPNEIKEIEEEEECDSGDSNAVIEVDNSAPTRDHTHTYSIQGKAVFSPNNKHVFSSLTPFHKKNSHLRASSINSRRHSSPVKLPRQVSRASLAQRRRPIVTRASSLTTRYAPMLNNQHINMKTSSRLDLESPGSVLVHANMRTLVNKKNFSILPASYRYKLTQLLPECDQDLIDAGVKDHKILAPSDSALANEFFTQAVQEWRERLSDGEFTRETQSRIMQEIAKERSKIDPWKEKFFEEYYGQKKLKTKRLRNRSQNLAAEAGHRMRDLGMEAQLAIFAHLRPELDEEDCSDPLISDDEDDVPLQKLLPPPTSEKLLTVPSSEKLLPLPNSEKSPSHATQQPPVCESLKKTSPIDEQSSPTHVDLPTKVTKKENLIMEKSRVTSIVMRPSWSGAVSMRLSSNTVESSPTNGGEGEETILDVRKQSGEGVIGDHSYTATPWKNSIVSSVNDMKQTEVCSTINSKPTTLILSPSGNLVQSTISILQKPVDSVLKKSQVRSSTDSDNLESDYLNHNKMRSLTNIKPTVHMIGMCSTPSDTERVLSLCARPLTPDSFAAGGNKTTGVISNVIKKTVSSISIKQAPSPLSMGHNIKQEPTLGETQSAPTEIKSRLPNHTSQSEQWSTHSASSTNAALFFNSIPMKRKAGSNLHDTRTIVLKNVALIKTPHNDKIATVTTTQHASSQMSSTPRPQLLYVSHPLVTTSASSQPPSSATHSQSSTVSCPSCLTHSLAVLSKPQTTSSDQVNSSFSQMRTPQISHVNHSPSIPFYSSMPRSFAPFANLTPRLSPPEVFPVTTSLPATPSSIAPPSSLVTSTLSSSVTTFAPSSSLTTFIPPSLLTTTASSSITNHVVMTRSSQSSSITVRKSLGQSASATALAQRPPLPPQPTSTLFLPRASLAGNKRAMSSSPSALSSPVRWPSSPNESPSPLKKTRTLAEIKAQIKAKRAAAGTRPTQHSPGAPLPQSSSQPITTLISNTNSHVFSATTFPVYFPNDPKIKSPFNHVSVEKSPTPASYIKLPTNSTLPLEKVQWVSHPDVKSSAVHGMSEDPVKKPPPKPGIPPRNQIPMSVVSSSRSSPLKSGGSGKRGKITLKIKAAGAAISLKVDADVIKKEMKRGANSPSTDSYLSSEDSSSDFSDNERPSKLYKHHSGPIKLPKVGSDSSNSDSDFAQPNRQRWSGINNLDTVQEVKGSNLTSVAAPSSHLGSVSASTQAVKSHPVFGEAPFNVSITPGTNIMNPPNHSTKSSNFHSNQSSLLFRNPTTTGPWSSSAVGVNNNTTNYPHKPKQSFRSTSKGKDMKNMQELARSNPFQSDDSTDDDDDDKADESFSSDDEKCWDTDDDDVMSGSSHRPTEVISLVTKRHTRSSVLGENSKNKSSNLTNMNTT